MPSLSPSSQGGNVVAVLPGRHWGKTTDRPLVIAAHWDAVPDSPGYNDNASGVAALLEIAATLANAKCLDNVYSIIFAALDLEEPGCLGSLELIRTYLKPHFEDKGVVLQARKERTVTNQ